MTKHILQDFSPSAIIGAIEQNIKEINMRQQSQFKVTIVFTEAALFFALPFGIVLTSLGLYGLARLVVTRNPQNTLSTMRSIGASKRFGWFSHGMHSIIAFLLGYRLASKVGRGAIPTIWMAIALAMSAHMGLHRMIGVPAHDLHTRFQYVRLPFMMLLSAFTGFHASYLWQK